MEQSMYLAIMEFFHVRRALGLHCSTATDPRPLSSVSPAFRECSNIRGTDPRDLYHLCHCRNKPISCCSKSYAAKS